MTDATRPYTISPVSQDEAAAFVRAVSRAFGRTEDDGEIAEMVEVELADPSLSLAARDAGTIIGTATVLDFAMTVPFADPVPCAGVTSVTTAPTHRRRGVLTTLMRRQLDDIRERGWSWAALYASESAIYGRFGYGLATHSVQARIDRAWTRMTVPAEPATVDLLTPEDAVGRVPAIYTRLAEHVPGMMTVPDRFWRHRIVWDPPGDRSGASGRFVAMIDDRAYALYRMRMGWDASGPDATIEVEECLATDSDAERQIWSYLFGIDLVQHVRIHRLALDHPLPWWLAERQRLHLSPSMPLYLRLVDVGRALSTRGTRGEAAVTVALSDDFCPWNAGTWQLEGDGSSLRCMRSDGPADIGLDVRALASLSLGGVSVGELVRAGLVEEHTPGAAVRLGALLASDRAPFNAFTF